jgi:ribosomal protein S18 acetylase RimI-like enzyme
VIRAVDPADLETAESLVAIQRAAYAVEARLIGVASLPPMTESAAELGASGLSVLTSVTDRTRGGEGPVAAFVAYVVEGDTVDVHRLVVDPRAFRQGHASRLLDALERTHPQARRILVGTAAANVPAMALYARRGFVPIAERDVGGGLRWVQLERALRSPR